MLPASSSVVPSRHGEECKTRASLKTNQSTLATTAEHMGARDVAAEIADWGLGVARLISSASRMWVNTGPGRMEVSWWRGSAPIRHREIVVPRPGACGREAGTAWAVATGGGR